MVWYHCIMSFYPLDEPIEYIAPSGERLDMTVDFWEQSICFDTEDEFDDWVANHPWMHNVVMVIDVKE